MIPDYQSLMLPVLMAVKDRELQTRALVAQLGAQLGLSDEERQERLPSGKQAIFDNRVNWAKSYLKQAGLVAYPKRGYLIATDLGRELLASKPERIDNKLLKQFDEFRAFQTRSSRTERPAQAVTAPSIVDTTTDELSTPDEELRAAHARIMRSLSNELLGNVRTASPAFFEELIIDLLLAMGYGGTSEDAARALGQTGDNGVDGVVDQDPLGVDQIYVQAKRYAQGNNVGAGDIRDFFGALNLKKAQKGIFFTTSSFSSAAVQTAKDLGMRIVLIDGEQLAKLMIRYSIGCREEDVLSIKKVDEDYFS